MALVAYDTSSDESDEESKFVKNQKQSVKIRIPSLKEFEDEEEEKPLAKKLKLQSGSGLFSLLPPPKHTSTLSKPGFIPHVFSSKKEQRPVTSSLNNCPEKKVTSTSSAISEEQESDDENLCLKEKSAEISNSAISNDFFWLDDLASNSKTNEDLGSSEIPVKSGIFVQNLTSRLPPVSTVVQPAYLNESKGDTVIQEPHLSVGDSNKADENLDYDFSLQQQMYSSGNYSENESVADPKGYLLKDKEFLKLQGRKREFGDINIIDVSADDQLTDKNEWLMKNMTEETIHRPKRKHGMPTQQQKRKHQITYLAFQAKEREMDLKNQWALNSRTRRETQAKYGF